MKAQREPRLAAVCAALLAMGGLALSHCSTPAQSADSKLSPTRTEPATSPAAAAPGSPDASSAPLTAGADSGAGPRRRCVVAAIGDSLSDPASHGGKYLETLRKRCPESQFYSYAKGGTMVNQMRRRFTDVVLGDAGSTQYTHLIVFGGINDILSDKTAHRTPSLVTGDLGVIYEAAQQHGMKVVAITITPWSGFRRWYNPSRAAATHEVNDWIRGQLGRNVNYLVDAWPLLSCGNPEALCTRYGLPFTDGIHFGPQGHEKLGEALYENAFSECL